ncbi:MAG: hypothetical protein QOC56_301 [Alphaproteobacteria bacterium]|jgi:hypothetical protein|nr:hypothetical protein [Alphaproteobacteria bacterium]
MAIARMLASAARAGNHALPHRRPPLRGAHHHPYGSGSGYGHKRPHYYGPSQAKTNNVVQKCYWLPTIAGGTVAGLEQKCIWIVQK